MKPDRIIENRDQSPPPSPAERAPLNPVQRGYRLIAPLYDYIFGLALWHGRRLAVSALDVRPGERVLEVGVGSGHINIKLSTVPVPAAVWLFGTALIGLVGLGKRRKAV